MIEPARKLAAKIPDVHTTYWTSKLLSKIKSEQESEVNYISRCLNAVLLNRNFFLGLPGGSLVVRHTECWVLLKNIQEFSKQIETFEKKMQKLSLRNSSNSFHSIITQVCTLSDHVIINNKLFSGPMDCPHYRYLNQYLKK